MFKETRILCLYAQTPLHPGTGSSLGTVDLPIQRERISQFPLIQASSVKGALRSYVPLELEQMLGTADDVDYIVDAFFGPRDSPDHAGAFSVTDARILLFPVRAMRGVFVWVTCRDVLWHLGRDLYQAGYDSPELPTIPELGQDEKEKRVAALVSSEGLLLDGKNGDSILLEEFEFRAQTDATTQIWADYLARHAMPTSDNGIYDFWADRLRSHLVILQKDDFRDFVLYGTEVVTRNRLDKVTKTVERGALFSEELLPAESLLYSSVHATDLRLPKDKWNRFRSVFPLPYNDSKFSAEDVLRWLREHIGADRPIQVGGDETVGRGLVQLRWLGE